MTKTIDDITNLICGDVLASVSGTALYSDAMAPMGLDIGGDEFAVNPYRRRPAPSPLAADLPDADTSNWIRGPLPVITAWKGADISCAYYLDGQTWRSCADDSEWSDV